MGAVRGMHLSGVVLISQGHIQVLGGSASRAQPGNKSERPPSPLEMVLLYSEGHVLDHLHIRNSRDVLERGPRLGGAERPPWGRSLRNGTWARPLASREAVWGPPGVREAAGDQAHVTN